MEKSRNSVEFAKYRLEKSKSTLESAIVLYDRHDLIIELVQEYMNKKLT